MVKRERKPAAATWATLSDYQQEFFYMHHPTDRIIQTTTFVTPVLEHWLIGALSIDPTTHRTMSGRATTELHLAPQVVKVFSNTRFQAWLTLQLWSARLVNPALGDLPGSVSNIII